MKVRRSFSFRLTPHAMLLTLFFALFALSFAGVGSAQTERWVYTHQESGGRNDAYAYLLTLGRDGNVYAAGSEFNGSGLEDFLVISLTPDSGRQRWHYAYNPLNNADLADAGLLYAPDGNLYVAGVSSLHSVCDLAVVSLDTQGGQRWTYDYNGPGNGVDWANGGPIWGGDGNLYVCGSDQGTGNQSNRAVVVSLTPLGAERWVYAYNRDNTADCFNDVAWGPDGNVYACGQDGWRTGLGPGFLVVSVRPDSGRERWTYTYDAAGGEKVDQAFNLVCGPDSNVYACGYSNGTIGGGNRDLTVVSLTPQGSERWVYRYNGPANARDSGTRIRIGPDGNLYVAGYSSNGTDDDGIVVSLTPSGGERWVYRYDSGPGDDDFYALSFDPAGRLFAAGLMGDAGTGSGWLSAVCLTLDGQRLWDYAYSGALGQAYEVAYGSDGSLYLGGATMGASGWVTFTVICLDARTGVEEESQNAKCKMQNANIKTTPNPFVSFATVPGHEREAFSLYDVSGRKVGTYQGDRVGEGLRAGVYFLRPEGRDAKPVRIVKVR